MVGHLADTKRRSTYYSFIGCCWAWNWCSIALLPRVYSDCCLKEEEEHSTWMGFIHRLKIWSAAVQQIVYLLPCWLYIWDCSCCEIEHHRSAATTARIYCCYGGGCWCCCQWCLRYCTDEGYLKVALDCLADSHCYCYAPSPWSPSVKP